MDSPGLGEAEPGIQGVGGLPEKVCGAFSQVVHGQCIRAAAGLPEEPKDVGSTSFRIRTDGLVF